MTIAVEIFVGVPATKQHDGLIQLCKKYKIDLLNLPENSAVIFINRNKTRIKCYAWNGVLSYMRSPSPNRPFSMDVLPEFARAFNPDGTLDYHKALRETLSKTFTSLAPLEEERLKPTGVIVRKS